METLLALMNERDKRYDERYAAQQSALLLAAAVAEKARGMISFAALVSIVSIFASIASFFK